MHLESKLEALADLLLRMPGAIVAYSGGADSAFLAEASHRVLGERSIAVIADSPSLPRRELANASQLASSRGWKHEVVQTRELDDPRYIANPTDRCYFCKSALFDVLHPYAISLGYLVLLGTNLDDLGDWRPGLHAARERNGRQPLVEAGFTKSDVRAASLQWGLPTFDKPAAACLASRFAYGVEVTGDGLARVEAAEDFLHDSGFEVVRVRDLGLGRARVEVDPSNVERILSLRQDVTTRLRRMGFREVQIDERGYSPGRLNEGVVRVALERP